MNKDAETLYLILRLQALMNEWDTNDINYTKGALKYLTNELLRQYNIA